MSSIRLIATDLDFTLLNEHFVLTETTKDFGQRRGICAMQFPALRGDSAMAAGSEKNPLDRHGQRRLDRG